MENTDIFLFTIVVVPLFLVFGFITIREFARAGSDDYKPQSDTRLK